MITDWTSEHFDRGSAISLSSVAGLTGSIDLTPSPERLPIHRCGHAMSILRCLFMPHWLAISPTQKLQYLEVLLIAPWSVRVGPGADVPLEPPADVLLPNPVSFIVQKLLIHEKRRPGKQAQDLLYIHDTLELFGGALEEQRAVWRDQVQPSMPDTTATRAATRARMLFEQVTDEIREAARIPETRRLSPENLRAASEYGLGEMFGA